MAVKRTCTSPRADGDPCKADVLPGEVFCFAHHPDMQERRKAGQRRGGKAKSNTARAAKLWAAVGREIPDADLPALLKACIVDVRAGRVEPAQATAIATLAKAAVQLHADIELEHRIEALEQEAGLQARGQLRRVG